MQQDIAVLSAALAAARRADAETPKFVVDQTEYRLTTLPDEPPLAWDVWVGAQGDIVVDKRAGNGLVRPAQTLNEGYLMISIKRLDARPEDSFLRRRCHEWVANAFHGPPPSRDAIVEHLNDQPDDNREENLCWSRHAENRASRTANRGKAVPDGKVRKVPISLKLIRELQAHTRLKGRGLAAFIEQVIVKKIREDAAA